MPIGSDQIHKGRCLCGSVQYEAEGVPVIVAHCHCEDCQQDSSGFEPSVVAFARNRKPWDTMDGSVPTFAAQPQWQPES